MTSDLRSLLERLIPVLEAANMPFMIAGSFASAAHGLPRATQDLDIVIDPTGSALESLLQQLSPESYYVDKDVAREALRTRGMFNVIDHATGWKVDFILRRNRPFSKEEFARRRLTSVLGVTMYMASAEDTIIAKLEWSAASGGSERQRRDVAGIFATAGDALDNAYLERWIAALGLETEWAAARATSVG